MAQVHAPYHFVPLSKWVYMPEWAHLVNHDHPFSDGLSGVIRYSLTNLTPLCVGDTEVKAHDYDPRGTVKFTRSPNNDPIIPGSSLKGMIRQVLSIATFGKFSQFDNQRFSFRDFQSERYKNTINEEKYDTKAGWLKFVDGKWAFREAEYEIFFWDDFKKATDTHLNAPTHGKNAISYYKDWELSKKINFGFKKRDFIYKSNEDARDQTVNCASFEGNGLTHSGRVVFSSFRPRILPQSIKVPSKKVLKKTLDHIDIDTADLRTNFAYLFYNESNELINDDAVHQAATRLSSRTNDLMVNSIKKMNGVRETNKQLGLFDAYLEIADPSLGIPVFAKFAKSTKKVATLSFAKMPHLDYLNTTKDLVAKKNPAHLSNAIFDFPELIFGTLRNNGDGLKSRVFFADATAKNIKPTDFYISNKVVLNNPKPAFFAAYLEQADSKDGAVYSDYDSTQPLSGTKRYISQQPDDEKLVSNAGTNIHVAGTLELCKPNKQFEGKIFFHNLRAVELGALLWSLQLEKSSCHQLGHGKPMGAGAVVFTTKLVDCRSNDENMQWQDQDYVQLFISHMEQQHPVKNWRKSPQIEYLLALGELENNKDVETAYMILDDNKQGSSTASKFKDAKREKSRLQPFKNIRLKEGLTRKESAQIQKVTAQNFGLGRLSQLIEESDKDWCTVLIRQREETQRSLDLQRQRDEEKKAEEEQIAEMTVHQLKVYKLKKSIFNAAQKTDYPPLIREVVHYFLANQDKTEKESAKALYELARENKYHETPKKRAKEQKEELKNLLELYGIEP